LYLFPRKPITPTATIVAPVSHQLKDKIYLGTLFNFSHIYISRDLNGCHWLFVGTFFWVSVDNYWWD
jgi:hypothetical protein